MRMKDLLLGLAVTLVGCARPHRAPAREDDPSIRFPNFHEHAAVTLGARNQPYELDGVTLQALLVAANDFLPPSGKEQPCRDRLEAHRYRVIRQGDIVFVQIEDDDEFCGLKYLSLDTGARYAISTDGRILRRSVGADPNERPAPQAPDAGAPVPQETGLIPPDLPPLGPDAESRDGGMGPVSPAVPSTPPGHEAGTPNGPR